MAAFAAPASAPAPATASDRKMPRRVFSLSVQARGEAAVPQSKASSAARQAMHLKKSVRHRLSVSTAEWAAALVKAFSFAVKTAGTPWSRCSGSADRCPRIASAARTNMPRNAASGSGCAASAAKVGGEVDFSHRLATAAPVAASIRRAPLVIVNGLATVGGAGAPAASAPDAAANAGTAAAEAAAEAASAVPVRRCGIFDLRAASLLSNVSNARGGLPAWAGASPLYAGRAPTAMAPALSAWMWASAYWYTVSLQNLPNWSLEVMGSMLIVALRDAVVLLFKITVQLPFQFWRVI